MIISGVNCLNFTENIANFKGHQCLSMSHSDGIFGIFAPKIEAIPMSTHGFPSEIYLRGHMSLLTHI